jgi:hypothetical protein
MPYLSLEVWPARQARNAAPACSRSSALLGRDPQYLISCAQFCYAACRLLGLSVGGQHSSAGSALAWLSYRRDRIRTDPRRHWHKIGDRHHRAFRSSPFLSSYNRGRSNGFALTQQKRRQSPATRQLTTASFVSPHAQLSCNMRSVSVLPPRWDPLYGKLPKGRVTTLLKAY